jgi:hypothetical protein
MTTCVSGYRLFLTQHSPDTSSRTFNPYRSCYILLEIISRIFSKIGQYVKRPIHCQLNWVILLCDVIPEGKTELTEQFWQAIAQATELSFPVVFHTHNCADHSGNPTFSSVHLPIPRRHHLKALNGTEQNLTNLNLCCARAYSVQVFVQFFCIVKLHSLTQSVWGPSGCMGPFRGTSVSLHDMKAYDGLEV